MLSLTHQLSISYIDQESSSNSQNPDSIWIWGLDLESLEPHIMMGGHVDRDQLDEDKLTRSLRRLRSMKSDAGCNCNWAHRQPIVLALINRLRHSMMTQFSVSDFSSLQATRALIWFGVSKHLVMNQGTEKSISWQVSERYNDFEVDIRKAIIVGSEIQVDYIMTGVT